MNSEYQNSGRSRGSRKHKKANFKTVFFTILIIAAVCVGLIIAGIYASGIRYKKVQITDSLYVKFLGKVDEEGAPSRGRIIYSNGSEANLDVDSGESAY